MGTSWSAVRWAFPPPHLHVHALPAQRPSLPDDVAPQTASRTAQLCPSPSQVFAERLSASVCGGGGVGGAGRRAPHGLQEQGRSCASREESRGLGGPRQEGGPRAAGGGASAEPRGEDAGRERAGARVRGRHRPPSTSVSHAVPRLAGSKSKGPPTPSFSVEPMLGISLKRQQRHTRDVLGGGDVRAYPEGTLLATRAGAGPLTISRPPGRTPLSSGDRWLTTCRDPQGSGPTRELLCSFRTQAPSDARCLAVSVTPCSPGGGLGVWPASAVRPLSPARS